VAARKRKNHAQASELSADVTLASPRLVRHQARVSKRGLTVRAVGAVKLVIKRTAVKAMQSAIKLSAAQRKRARITVVASCGTLALYVVRSGTLRSL
jgi:hypothetical protein